MCNPLTLKTGTEESDERSPVFLTEEAVEDKIAGRVDRQQEVEDIAQTTDQTPGVGLVHHRIEHCVYEDRSGGQLADEKQNDHCYQHYCDSRLLFGRRVQFGGRVA